MKQKNSQSAGISYTMHLSLSISQNGNTNTASEPPVHAQRKEAFDLPQLQIIRNMYVLLPGRKKIQVKAENLLCIYSC